VFILFCVLYFTCVVLGVWVLSGWVGFMVWLLICVFVLRVVLVWVVVVVGFAYGLCVILFALAGWFLVDACLCCFPSISWVVFVLLWIAVLSSCCCSVVVVWLVGMCVVILCDLCMVLCLFLHIFRWCFVVLPCG